MDCEKESKNNNHVCRKTHGVNSNSKLDSKTQPRRGTLTAAGVRESAAAPRDSTSIFRH